LTASKSIAIENICSITAESMKNLIVLLILFLLTSCSSDPQPKLTLTLNIDGAERVNESADGDEEIERLVRAHSILINSMDAVCSPDQYETARSNLREYLVATFLMQKLASYVIKREFPIEGSRSTTEELLVVADFGQGKFACSKNLNG